MNITWRTLPNGNVEVQGDDPRISWPVIIVNPPTKVPDGDGFRVDPDEAIRETIRGLVE
jgi:hypothetical protein